MIAAAAIAADWFPRAAAARQARPFPGGVCEPPPLPAAPFAERHLQCVWADDRLRPVNLATAAGERVQVEHPGEWNTGPGPDFLNAALRVGPELRRIVGDVEIHVRPADWQRHRHAGDPRYRRVCAHVSYYPGTLPAAELPAGALQIALRPALDATPDFSFDNIDLLAYPVAARASPPPCRAAMARRSPAQRGAVLDAAGESRLRRRAADPETKAFLRRCWDAWWPLSGEFLARRLPRADWTLAGLRPANRPERRLMAAALLFAPAPSLPERIAAVARDPHGAAAENLLALFDLPAAPYWSRRLSFATPPAQEPIALVGKSRAQAILVNLLLPAFAALGAPAAAWQALLADLPAEEPNELIRQTALRLFGQDHSPRLYRSGLRRQGLVQIHHDYCLGDRSLCAACPFPSALETPAP